MSDSERPTSSDTRPQEGNTVSSHATNGHGGTAGSENTNADKNQARPNPDHQDTSTSSHDKQGQSQDKASSGNHTNNNNGNDNDDGEELMPGRLFVGSLPRHVTAEAISDLFSDLGFKTSKVSPKGGFCFVELEDPSKQDEAIAKVNGMEWQGKVLQVKPGKKPRPSNVGCYTCGEHGHKARACPRNGGGRGRGGGGGGRSSSSAYSGRRYDPYDRDFRPSARDDRHYSSRSRYDPYPRDRGASGGRGGGGGYDDYRGSGSSHHHYPREYDARDHHRTSRSSYDYPEGRDRGYDREYDRGYHRGYDRERPPVYDGRGYSGSDRGGYDQRDAGYDNRDYDRAGYSSAGAPGYSREGERERGGSRYDYPPPPPAVPTSGYTDYPPSAYSRDPRDNGHAVAVAGSSAVPATGGTVPSSDYFAPHERMPGPSSYDPGSAAPHGSGTDYFNHAEPPASTSYSAHPQQHGQYADNGYYRDAPNARAGDSYQR